MTTATVTEVLETIRTLSRDEFAELSEAVDAIRISRQSDEWEPNDEQVAEIRRRLRSVDDGARTNSWEEVKARMRAARTARAG